MERVGRRGRAFAFAPFQRAMVGRKETVTKVVFLVLNDLESTKCIHSP